MVKENRRTELEMCLRDFCSFESISTVYANVEAVDRANRECQIQLRVDNKFR